MRNSSLQLQGLCYPLIFPSVNVYWSCQYIARASNLSLSHWQKMNGVNIQDDMIIDKSIRRSLDSRASVVKRYVADIGKSWPVLIELTHVRGVAILMTFISVIAILTSVAIIHRMYSHGNISPQAAKVIGEVQALIIFRLYHTQCSLYSICSGYRRLSIYSVLVSIRYTPHITIAIFFHRFGCYWDTQFFSESSATVITGSVASYYLA
ncbi:hypothetical protein IGI04_003574 [Brassica rapa subsp. trilocularis]|uniref:Choline transporter-like protein n=1 Tax=Brassica rapa subsp. trilocularis TaxID=1813537 RepID=A0ABQ7NYT9_BRACM|nr:hypothetical protein IGI04_003574 [Brassica rapa subsp. trilocularis]